MQNNLLLICLAAVAGCSQPSQAPATSQPSSQPASQPSSRPASQPSSQPASANKLPPGPLPELSILQLEGKWNTQQGESIELKDLRGEVLVIVMIYTSCKAACPRLVADMRSIEKKVGAKVSEGVRYVLVSIDPQTDTPARLKTFAADNKMQDPKWLFLQGTTDGVLDFANVLAVKYKKISPMDFSHSNIISVFDAEGVLVHQQEGLSVNNAQTVQAIIKLASSGG